MLFSSFFLSSLIIEKNTFEVRIYVTLILNLLSYFSTFTCYIDYNIRTCIVISNAHTMLSPGPQLLKGNISPIFKIKELWIIVFQPLACGKVFWRTFFILSVLFFKQAWQSETSLEQSVWTLMKLWFLNRKPTLLAYSNENEQSRKAVEVEWINTCFKIVKIKRDV